MFASRRAFAAAPSFRFASGRSIAAPVLRYSTGTAAASAQSSPAPGTAATAAEAAEPAAKSYAKPRAPVKPRARAAPAFAKKASPVPKTAAATPAPATTPPAIAKTTPLGDKTQEPPLLAGIPIPKTLDTPPGIIWNPTAPPPRTRPLQDPPLDIDWEKSFHGLGTSPVSETQFAILSKPLSTDDIEVKPDGIVYMPEIKYRRRLNEAFGPMGWGIVPRGDAVIGKDIVTREYALIANGCFVSQAMGVNNYFSTESIPQAIEGAKSNALMRCCKDLSIASELWDPIFIRWFTKVHLTSAWAEHATTKKKRRWFFKKGDPMDVPYPYKLS